MLWSIERFKPLQLAVRNIRLYVFLALGFRLCRLNIYKLLRLNRFKLCHLIVFHNRVEQSRSLEEVVRLEGVQLVELHLVNTELNIANRFGYEILVTLEREKLESYTVNLVELLKGETLNIEFCIGFKLALATQVERMAVYTHI